MLAAYACVRVCVRAYACVFLCLFACVVVCHAMADFGVLRQRHGRWKTRASGTSELLKLYFSTKYRCTVYFVLYCHSFIHSFILAISIAPLEVLYYSEALPTTARILYRSFTPKRTEP